MCIVCDCIRTVYFPLIQVMSQGKTGRLQELMMQRAERGAVGGLDTGVWDAGLVAPGLYVGSLRAALDTGQLQVHGVAGVITAAGRLNVTVPGTVKHLVINIADHPSENILPILDATLQFIDDLLDRSDLVVGEDKCQKPSAVLVHCASGVSRSVAVCCAWLMSRKELSFEQSLAQIRLNRPLSSPNIGFKIQLNFLQQVNGDIHAAIELFKTTMGSRKIADIIFEQREAANSLHASVDFLEERIQKRIDLHNNVERLDWKRQLMVLQVQLDEKENLATSAVVDSPSLMIRRAALSKVFRLLQLIADFSAHNSLSK